jgi:hypothetical protein
MTEQQWLECSDPQKMLEFLRGKASDRKRRLFAVACCWRVADLLTTSGKAGLQLAEQFADQLINQGELHGAWKAIGFPKESARRYAASAARAASSPWPLSAYDGTAHGAASAVNARKSSSAPGTEDERQAALLRDIFGNPFRPVAVDPSWLTWNNGAIPKLAEAIYNERAFDRLPILADALEEAGCDNADILAHCRAPGPHCCGCWAVDALLSKT